MRAGLFFAVPLTVQAPVVPPVPLRVLRRQVVLAAVRSGKVWSPPRPQPAPPPPPWAPAAIARDRIWLAGGRRGGFCAGPVTPGGPPPAAVRRHRGGLPARPGHFGPAPAPGAPLVRPVRRRTRPGLPALRRPHRFEPALPQAAAPIAPPYTPITLKGRRGIPALRIHGRVMPGWMALTTSPVVEGPAVLSSTSASPAGLSAAFGAAAALSSSDSPVASIGGE
ncbi:hypothetical protein ACIBEJ_34325 [Nonomuraea sp. NPDC050790]|uniref:hypothetical protein n=1 Tax=Nonomuraea sp. NPDC050790 TaxID=3364371 RepID=UPI0037B6AD48